MGRPDFTIFYKSVVDWSEPNGFGDYDVFVSAYNASDRVGRVFCNVRAKRKIWAIQPELRFCKGELPTNGVLYFGAEADEIAFGVDLVGNMGPKGMEGVRMAIDVTGFIQPNMMYLLWLLYRHGVRSVECLYSEPISYVDREDTRSQRGMFWRFGRSRVSRVS